MRPRDPVSHAARAAIPFAALALSLFAPGPARAEVSSVSVIPAAPVTCDSATIRVAGNLETSCQQLLRWSLAGPTPENIGGVVVQRFDAMIVAEDPNPRILPPCANDQPPYSIDFPVGLLPPGPYAVRATEYRVPFGSDAPFDSSSLSFRFGVAPGDTCPAGPPCVLLSFLPADSSVPPPPTADRAVLCDGAAPPGGTGCFAVGLVNPVPVGGVQVQFSITDMTAGPLPAGQFTPLSVQTTPRTRDFTVSWTADGPTVKAVLYSASGATIAPGRGPILRACYGVSSDTREMAFPIYFGGSLVADANGNEVPDCPTFAVIQGWFCVGTPPPSCDLNGDGRSDIRDVILLVRCALDGAGSDGCPDTVAARADCDGNGTIDVRDVICCVRKILASGLLPPTSGGAGNAEPTRIEFAGPAAWTDPADGRATIEISPASDFAGAQFIVAPGAGIRIRDVSLLSSAPGATLEWSTGADGSAHVMFFGTAGPAPSAPIVSGAASLPARIAVDIEPTGGAGAPASTLSLQSIGGATWDGVAAAAESPRPTAEVPATAVSAPAVYPARPNPFAGSTELSFALPTASRVSLRLYDVSGRLVRTLVDGERDAGVHHVAWDGRNEAGAAVVSGIYFVKFSANGVTRSDRILKLR